MRRENLFSYLIVGPFAIVLAFPFYWMLMTSLRADNDLYDIEQVPFKFNADSPTTANYRFLFEQTDYRMAREHGDRRRSRRPDHARPRASGGLRARPALGTLGSECRGRDLPDVPRPADAPLPASLASGGRAELQRSAVVADPRLPLVHRALLDLAADGVLQDNSPGARGRCPRRRRVTARRACAGRFPALGSRDLDGGDLFVLARLQRVRLRDHVHLHTETKTVSAGVPIELIRGDVFYWGALMAATLIPAIPLALLYNPSSTDSSPVSPAARFDEV